ncbi:MAG: DUF2953 domain-containing protein [Clostridiales bacterium]|nr:DUF2953 domain-containing protein [Clostridiales bacterium]
MLHIVLLILKIIGIILACIIGLLLLLILLVLFVSVRYKGEGSYDQKPLYTVKVGWIPGVVSLTVTNISGKNRMRLRVFGIPLIDTSRKKKEDQKKKEHSAEKSDHTTEYSASEIKGPVQENVNDDKRHQTNQDDRKKTEPEDKCESKKTEPEDKRESKKPESEDKLESKKTESEDRRRNKKPKKKRPGLKERFVTVKKKVTGFKETVRKKLEKISESFKDLSDKKEKVGEIFFSDQGRSTILKMKILLFKLLRHIMPKKLSGSVYFGTGDPYTTARILCILGALYPVYSPEFEVTPDFNEKVIEGHIYIRGRIRLIVILWIAIKVKFDKGLNHMIKAVKNL